MPACHLTEPERTALVGWLERHDNAYHLPAPVRAGLDALRREDPIARGLKEAPNGLVHRSRTD